jgi:catechol 2,3-dioxygenase-like lactoylglutathione lyase family enzyme
MLEVIMKHLHVHIGVSDLEKSKTFYSTLFGKAPDVVKDDYAKWMLDDPRVNFAITPKDRPGLSHLGFQAETGDELQEIADRLHAADLATFDETNTTCCYAQSDKAWVADPDGVVWENFKTHGVSETFGAGPEVEIEDLKAHVGAQNQAGCGCC